MNILILGAAGFIGTNLTIKLAENKDDQITLVDKKMSYFSKIKKFNFSNVKFKESSLDENMDFSILKGQDIIYHLVSTNTPSTSNQHISQDIQANVLFTSNLLDSCVENEVKKVVFISSGGTVYGRENKCPLSENTPTNPISSYGVQKIMIEKLLYLYNYKYGMDYRIIRLTNPYGPYQRPNGVLGAVTTFTYKALKGEEIQIFGDGTVIRDFIYIDDVVRAILNIVNGENKYRTFNLGCGYGISIKEVLETVKKVVGKDIQVVYKNGRSVDVPVNYLDISRYEKYYGKLNPVSLEDGIKKTVSFMEKEMVIK
ncbi:epimerase [Dubosiella newyorkensis]|uniref:Epimerase n=2 Tax=Dubosiella newyorkensis TaxID=1862672 RepID=A0A1U7NKK7_9FIRM|nr:epimerase [Dubosiella newyorkensis]